MMNAQRDDTEDFALGAEQSPAAGPSPLPVPIARAPIPAKGEE